MSSKREHGQAVVEFSIIVSVLFVLSLGLVDVGRAFFAYNAISAAARYGSRWGSVVGGTFTCGYNNNSSTTDWCSQQGGNTTSFWSQAGNSPLQGTGSCETSQYTTDFYHASDPRFTGSTATSIVGAVVHRFDTGSNTSNAVLGAAAPGVDLSRLWVCIQISPTAFTGGVWQPQQGDTVQVVLYYRFQPINSLVTKIHTMDMVATSQYVVE